MVSCYQSVIYKVDFTDSTTELCTVSALQVSVDALNLYGLYCMSYSLCVCVCGEAAGVVGCSQGVNGVYAIVRAV